MSSSDPRDHNLHQLSFEDASADSTSFFQAPPVTDPSLISYNTATSGNPYTMYEQNQLFSYSNYPQPIPLPPYDPNFATQFTSYPHPQSVTQSGLANIIPPTPQDNQSSSLFDFNTPPTNATIPSNQHLVASPCFSQISHRSSLSSLSRSCSPVPSTRDASSGRTRSAESRSALRPPLRSASTSSSASLHTYGIPVPDPGSATMLGTSSPFTSTSSPAANGSSSSAMTQYWRCAYPGCTSQAKFTRGCDLRKHYNRHSKHLFCRVEGCPQSEAAAAARAINNSNDNNDNQPLLTGGFSSKKDRARHEAKHNPGIKCEWRGPDGEECSRVFSRMDNMKDHVRRIHHKGQQPHQKASQSRK